MHTRPTLQALTDWPREHQDVHASSTTGISLVATHPLSEAWALAIAALTGERCALTYLDTNAPQERASSLVRGQAWLALGVCSDLSDGLRILEFLLLNGNHEFVLLLSAQREPEVGVALLNAGADFWLPGDTEPQLIASIVHAARRRGLSAAELPSRPPPAVSEPCAPRQELPDVVIEPMRLTIRIGDHAARLRSTEFKICQYLIQHRERWVPDPELRALLTAAHSSNSLVRVHMHQIRRALGRYRSCLQSKRLLGYRFVPQFSGSE
jgi:DNA-binding response OmpR family regulator